MAAYRARADQLDIKCHGTWSSDAFWRYITVPCMYGHITCCLVSGCCHHSTVIVCLFTIVAFCTCHPYMSFIISFYFFNFIPFTLSSRYIHLVMWALRRGRGTSCFTHRCGLTSSGVKAGPGPGVNVSDSERMTCYVRPYIP